MAIDLAKAVGFVSGTCFAYFANRYWTFGHGEHKPKSGWRFCLLYAITLTTNIFINSIAIKLLSDKALAIQISFVLATGVSALLNFLGMKMYVFKTIEASTSI